MGHVIAGGAMGRDISLYGADVLNIWRPRDSEVEGFAWDVQVGMRSTVLDDAKEDRARLPRDSGKHPLANPDFDPDCPHGFAPALEEVGYEYGG
jgi:hypothetical protein